MEGAVKSEVDSISNLPFSIIENILGCLPLRDVVRTSILSREWRYKWLTCPEIVLDFWFDQMFLGRHKLGTLVYQILRLHKGPLLRFVLRVPDLKSSPDIDEWIRLLASDILQDLTLHVSRGNVHKLTSHLFTFQNIRNLKLYNCTFDPPAGFKGFGKLVNLDLQSVAIAQETFGKFIASCPAVERLRLVHCNSFNCLGITGPELKFLEFHGVFRSISFKNCPVLTNVKISFASMDFKMGNQFSFDLVKSLSSLPSLEELQLQAYALEELVEDGAPNKLPIALKTLKTLHLSDMYFEKAEEISCAICFIRSSPNLQKLKITVSQLLQRISPRVETMTLPFFQAFTFDNVHSVSDFLRSQKRLEALSQLKTVKMQLFSGTESEMEFVKYLSESATALEELAITPQEGSVSDGERILNQLKQFPRASPAAEIFNSDEKLASRYV